MTFEEMQAALNEAKRIRRVAANHAQTIAELFEDAMGEAGSSVLRRIKRKLRSFDMKRGCWTTK